MSGDSSDIAKQPTLVHASCVALDGRAILITGRSGSGKSALALELMALGADLVADDQVALTRRDERLFATAPPTIAGRIEARFMGILAAETVQTAQLVVIVDLDQTETDRLPPLRTKKLLGMDLPLLHNARERYFPAAILHYLRAGRVA